VRFLKSEELWLLERGGHASRAEVSAHLEGVHHAVQAALSKPLGVVPPPGAMRGVTLPEGTGNVRSSSSAEGSPSRPTGETLSPSLRAIRKRIDEIVGGIEMSLLQTSNERNHASLQKHLQKALAISAEFDHMVLSTSSISKKRDPADVLKDIAEGLCVLEASVGDMISLT